MAAKRILIWIYALGSAVTAAGLIWNAFENGGFQRSHSVLDLCLIAAHYLFVMLIWPCLLIFAGLHFLWSGQSVATLSPSTAYLLQAVLFVALLSWGAKVLLSHRSTLWRGAVAAVAMISAVGGIAVVSIWYFTVGVLLECTPTIRDQIASPSGRISAVVFEMECGATVPFNTQVSLLSDGYPFSPNRNPSFLSVKGRRSLLVKWHTDSELHLSVPADAQPYKKAALVDGITITYGD